MKPRTVAVVLALAALVACQKKAAQTTTTAPGRRVVTTTEPPDMKMADVRMKVRRDTRFMEGSSIGSKPDAEGNVTGDQKTFKYAEPIYVTMRLKESPPGLQASIAVIDPVKGTDLLREPRVLNGATVTTFKIAPRKLERGRYHIRGYWGGNTACDYDITVE